MPKSFEHEQALREIAAVEQALAEGHPPATPRRGSNRYFTACTVAAERLGVISTSLRNRVGTPDTPGMYFRLMGLTVDWTKYKPVPVEPLPALSATAANTPKEAVPEVDPLIEQRLRAELLSLRAERNKLLQRLANAEDLRAGVLGLTTTPPAPVNFPARTETTTQAETIVLFLSDLHWGERITFEAMDGLNSYDLSIARKRLGRWSNAVCDLATKHWSGPTPDRIILILGGDLISGGIHHELAKTDELQPLPTVRDVASHLRMAILQIKQAVDCPLDIILLGGNHGRTTLKPESKNSADTSLDVLVCDFLEMSMKDIAGITFYAPPSPDALFSVYGWRILATHGDRIGSRGGHGFVGPAAPAARGFKRIVADYSARGVHLDLILIGHLHCPLELEEGFVNGALPGPSEYSRDGRFRPKPAVQLFLAIHPHRINTQRRWIEVGDPSEGSLYVPPPPDTLLRPRYRIGEPT